MAATMLPFTKFRHFTDEWGCVDLPWLCDEFGDQDTLASQHDAMGHCHSCDQPTDLNFVTYPCVLRVKERHRTTTYGYDDWNGVHHPDQLIAETEFALCPTCEAKCNVLLKTSDHIALGYDWWDILDSLSEKLKTYQLPTTNYPVTNIVRSAAKTMCTIEDGANGTTGPLSGLCDDILGLIAKQMLGAYKRDAAKKILGAYRKWHNARWPQRAYAGDVPSFNNHYYSCRHNEWSHCSDCGATRHCCDLTLREACVDDDCSTEKWVCVDGCTYICHSCNGSNRIAESTHRSCREQYADSAEIKMTPWDCYHCGKEMMLHWTRCAECHRD